MIYDRMAVKPIPGEICRFCSDDSASLAKTPCCDQWIFCDMSYLSYRGGGYCQFEHENDSICHFHYHENHHGRWQDGKECRCFFGEEEFKRLDEYAARLSAKNLEMAGRGVRIRPICYLESDHPSRLYHIERKSIFRFSRFRKRSKTKQISTS